MGRREWGDDDRGIPATPARPLGQGSAGAPVTRTQPRGARQSRSVTFVYGGIAGILLVVIAAVALVLTPPSPPAVAEFTPSPDDVIDEAPQNQSSRFGAGDGTCTSGQTGCEYAEVGPASTVPAPEKREIVRARVRRCVGDPPRQIEDPQSPPCVNYWEGDNGGATSKGVTRDSIRVAMIDPDRDRTLVEFFNRRFEFYGRKIVLVPPNRPFGGSNDPAVQRAAAVAVDEQQAFAALDHGYSVSDAYYEELAARGIISIGGPSQRAISERGRYRRSHPYRWSYTAAQDEILLNAVDWLCSSMRDRPASHAGDPALRARTRRVAVVKGDYGSGSGGDPLVYGLRDCGFTVNVEEFSYTNSGGGEQAAQQARTVVAKLQASGVTSVATLGQNELTHLMEQAAQVGYSPEWLSVGLSDEWEYGIYQNYRTGNGQYFGLLSRNKLLDLIDRPWYHAVKEVDPTRAIARPDVWQDRYTSLLVLASGIQMAGPNLTPASFARGLVDTQFPNPGCGGPPFYQACVDFAPDDHTMVDDFVLGWWNVGGRSPEADTRDTSNGQWCWIDMGKRYTPGSYPTTPAPFFDLTKPCR